MMMIAEADKIPAEIVRVLRGADHDLLGVDVQFRRVSHGLHLCDADSHAGTTIGY